MIKFFRDILDGPFYYIIAIICIFFIMAIIGFLMERKKLEKEMKERTAVIDQKIPISPITPVEVSESSEEMDQHDVVNDQNVEDNSQNLQQNSNIIETKKTVIDFNESTPEK